MKNKFMGFIKRAFHGAHLHRDGGCSTVFPWRHFCRPEMEASERLTVQENQ
jgi:hypothetical protein